MAAHAVAAPRRFSGGGLVARIVFAGVLLFLVFWIPSVKEDWTTVAAQCAIFAMVGLSLNVIIGYTGQLSLGHQGFFGIGAFSAAYAATERGVPFEASLAVAIVVGALAALLLGIVALRITGLYLALITLVFGLTLQQSLFQVGWLTQGGAGQPADRPEYLLSLYPFFLLCLGLLAAVVFIDVQMTRSKIGRALFALRENERVAEAFGVNVTAYKLLAFVISGGIAGLAGALFAYLFGGATGNDFDFFLALTFVLMTVVGGLNSRVGVILASTLFASLETILHWGPIHHVLSDGVGPVPGFGSGVQFAPQLIGALLLITTLIFNPGGVAQQLSPIVRWFTGAPHHDHHESGPGAVEGSSVRA